MNGLVVFGHGGTVHLAWDHGPYGPCAHTDPLGTFCGHDLRADIKIAGTYSYAHAEHVTMGASGDYIAAKTVTCRSCAKVADRWSNYAMEILRDRPRIAPLTGQDGTSEGYGRV